MIDLFIQSRRGLLAAALIVAAGCGGEGGGAAAETSADSTPAADSVESVLAGTGPRAEAPPQIRGLYLNAYAGGSRNRMRALLAIADSTEINTFVIDMKDERGVHYPTSLPLPKELSAPGEITIRDPKALTDTLHAHGIYAIARIVVFKDPILSKARPAWSVQKPDGGLWADRAGNTWVSPWSKEVWDYNIDIAEEAARAGFDEIQFDYVRFAEPYRRTLPPQVHPQAQGDRTDAIAAFLNEAKRRLHPLGVTVTADVFGLSPNTFDDVDIGQQWETIASTADHILPMMYPSHYLPTHLPGVPKPDLMPYEVLYKSAGMAVVRNNRLREVGVTPARIIPWLQAFTANWLREHQEYGPDALRKQKQGVYDTGLDDWILWHPGSRYEHIVPALEPATEPRAKGGYSPPADVLATLDRFEGQGVRAARERAAHQARGETVDPAAAQAARSGQPDSAAAGP